MPLVLASNEITASGHTYEDITGVSYEYPLMYQHQIREGKRFIYYRGSRRASGVRDVPVYLGTGLVGEIRPSENPEHFVCAILDYQPFLPPVPFKDEEGQPFEAGGSAGGRYYQRGVRSISEAVFNAILSRADVAGHTSIPSDSPRSPIGYHAYASPDVAKAVEEFAMRVALERARVLFPGRKIIQRSHNNPGFDILVEGDGSARHYIEVKGSTAPTPRFFLTEGERLFSAEHASDYTLMVIYSIDLETGDHHVLVREGPISSEGFQMTATQWLCSPISPAPEESPQSTRLEERVPRREP